MKSEKIPAQFKGKNCTIAQKTVAKIFPLLMAIGGLAATGLPQLRAIDYDFTDGSFLTISGSPPAIDSANNILGTIPGTTTFFLNEFHFNGTVHDAFRGKLIIARDTTVVFDHVADFLNIASGKTGEILLETNTELWFKGHTRTTTLASGGAISTGGDAYFYLIGASSNYSGKVRFSQNTVDANGGNGGAIGATAAAGQAAEVNIFKIQELLFEDNHVKGGGVGTNVGGAISARGNGNGTEASVSINVSGTADFVGNSALTSGGAISAMVVNNQASSGSGVSVGIGADSIRFVENFIGTQGGGYVGSGSGGAISVNTGSSAQDIPAIVSLSTLTGDILFAKNKSAAGAAISLRNYASSAGRNRATSVYLISGGKIVFSENETVSTSTPSGAVEILGGGGNANPTFSAFGMQGVEIKDNAGRGIYVSSYANPALGEEYAVSLSSYQKIELVRNRTTPCVDATGAAISVDSGDINGVNSFIKISAENNLLGDVAIRENSAVATTYTTDFAAAVRGGGAISAIGGSFDYDHGMGEESLDSTVAKGAASVHLSASGKLLLVGNSLELKKEPNGAGSRWDAVRSTQFIGGGAIFVFSTAEYADTPLFDLDAEGDILISNNKAFGTANPHGGAISASSIQNDEDPNIWPNAPTIDVPIPAAGKIAPQGKLEITQNEVAGKGGAIYLNAATGKASLEITPGAGGGSIANNKAGTGNGFTAATGGALHIQGKTGANLTIDVRGIGAGETFSIQNNTVGSADSRAIYIETLVSGNKSAGDIVLATASGTTLALYDGFDAVAAKSTAGYSVSINPISGTHGSATPGTFAQIGANSKIAIPGTTTVSGGTHSLANGALYQTFTGSSTGGSYKLNSGATIALSGTGNTIASGNFEFAGNSAFHFDLGNNFAPNNATALLVLEGKNRPSTSGGKVLPGANNVVVTGNLRSGGNYYMLNAEDLGANSVANSGNLTTANLTVNGNTITAINVSTPSVGRNYIVAELLNTNPSQPDANANKLFLHINSISGNIENRWTGAAGNLWKSEPSGRTAANWDGAVPTDGGNAAPTDVFLHGDLVSFAQNTGANHAVTVDGSGVVVGRMEVSGDSYTFSGGRITGSTTNSTFHPSVENVLIPKTDGTLHIGNGGNVTLKNTIQFSGNSNAANKIGVQVEGIGAKLTLADGGHLGAGDSQDVHVNNGGAVGFDRNQNYTYKGVVSGNGDFTKTGNGALFIGKNQAYTGEFSVAGGKVVLQNVTQNALGGSLAANATLAGNGVATAGGNFKVSGIISPGGKSGELGKLEFGKSGTWSVDMSAGGRYVVDIIGGVGADLLVVHGNLTTGSGAKLEFGNVQGKFHNGEEYVLVSLVGGQLVGNYFDQPSKVTLNGNEFDLVYRRTNGGTDAELVLITTYAVPILPEPSTYALCGTALTLLLAAFRRHLQKSRKI